MLPGQWCRDAPLLAHSPAACEKKIKNRVPSFRTRFERFTPNQEARALFMGLMYETPSYGRAYFEGETPEKPVVVGVGAAGVQLLDASDGDRPILAEYAFDIIGSFVCSDEVRTGVRQLACRLDICPWCALCRACQEKCDSLVTLRDFVDVSGQACKHGPGRFLLRLFFSREGSPFLVLVQVIRNLRFVSLFKCCACSNGRT